MTPTAVAYYRVSTQKQGQSGLGLEAQKHAVEAYARSKGLSITESYIELETGTGKRQRPEIHRAIKAAKAGGSVLLIGKLDRLARSVAFVSGLMESGVNFVAVDMPDANRLTVHIMAALAEHEARMISQRTKEALAQAKARGTRLGSPANLTIKARLKGAKANEAKALQADRQVAGYAKALRDGGWSYPKIAQRLNSEGHSTRRGGQWHPMQVKRVLNRQRLERLGSAAQEVEVW
jgi:DNA invertase Pin-like site-specific DNA recombinase